MKVSCLLPLVALLSGASAQPRPERILVKAPGGYPVGWLPSDLNRTSPGAHSYDLENHYKWMGELPDDRPLASLSIPGTQDSLAGLPNLPSWRRSQNWHILKQLNAGIRYVDIPLREKDGLLWASSITYRDGKPDQPQEKEYGCPLSGWPEYQITALAVNLAGWLQQNRREVLLVRIRRDPRDTLRPNFDNKTFAKLFAKHLSALDLEPYGRLTKYFYDNDGKPIDELPTLGQARDKVILLLDFEGAEQFSSRGIPWNSTLIHVDKYRSDLAVKTPHDMETKWTDANRHLTRADSATNGKLHITNLAGGGIRQFPPEVVAAGGSYSRVTTDVRMDPELRSDPLVIADSVVVANKKHRKMRHKAKNNDVIVGMNERLLRTLSGWKPSGDEPRKTGIVVMGVPGRDLVEAIIKLNSA